MALRSDLSSDRRPSWGTLAIAVLALVGAMLVFVVNGGPLFYFDTAVYIGQGNATLHMILPHSWFAAPVAGAASEGGLASGGVGGTVNGSRSIVYSLMLASADQLRLLWAFPVFQAGAVALTLWLVVKTWLRSDVLAAGPGLVIAVSILAASFGALPFYIPF